MSRQFAEVERLIGPPLRQSVIVLTGSPPLHRTTWICGCSLDFTEAETVDDGDPDTFNPSLRWHRCAYHRRVVQLSSVT
jgi:hypothetical protein